MNIRQQRKQLCFFVRLLSVKTNIFRDSNIQMNSVATKKNNFVSVKTIVKMKEIQKRSTFNVKEIQKRSTFNVIPANDQNNHANEQRGNEGKQLCFCLFGARVG